jgi:hypothetical protein
MSGPPAEPLGDRAAELALELNKFMAVLLAVVLAGSDCLGSALTTDQLFRLELLCFFVILLTILPSSKIWGFALEAHVVS